MAAEVTYNQAWYTFGVGLSKKSVTTKSYTPFGEQIGEAISGYGYNGEYYNAATGQVYLRARFYEPELNRFSQKDPLRGSVAKPTSLNRYLYCANDPVNYADCNGKAMMAVDYINMGGGAPYRETAPTDIPDIEDLLPEELDCEEDTRAITGSGDPTPNRRPNTGGSR